MASTKTGILGGIKGSINEVTLYRRLQKNVITSRAKLKSINHVPSLVSNSQKLTRIMSNYKFLKTGINRMLITFYGSRTFTADELFLANQSYVINADSRILGPFIVPIKTAFYNNSFIQNIRFDNSTVEAISINQFRSSIIGGTNLIRRFRYTSYNNSLTNTPTAVSSFSQGIATSFIAGANGSIYLAATCLTDNPYTKCNDLFISGYRKLP